MFFCGHVFGYIYEKRKRSVLWNLLEIKDDLFAVSQSACECVRNRVGCVSRVALNYVQLLAINGKATR